MIELLGSLLPLMIGSALVPVQIVITVLLLRAPGGRSMATAWVAGMVAVRVLQGVIFGLILGPAVSADDDGGPSTVASVLLLVVAIVFYIGAGKQLLKHPDEDAPPPRWMAAFDQVRPDRAFLMGGALTLLSAKFWAFTLGAIAVIEDADLGGAVAIAWYALFVVVAASVHLALLGLAWLAPERSEDVLTRLGDGLERWNRPIMIALGLVFGTWFLAKALGGLGIL